MTRRLIFVSRCTAALITLFSAARASALQVTGFAYADSATVARTAWRDANTAMRANDLAGARKAVARAATAWPTQEAYAWARAILAATARDTNAVASALAAYADAGFGKMASADARFAPFSAVPTVNQAIARIEANAAPVIRSTIRARLEDSTFWAEGMDYDPRTKRYYVASVRHRTIAELSPNGVTRELMAREQPNIGAMMGVRVDTARGVLWATTAGIPQMAGYVPRDSAIAALLRIRISDGAIEQRWDLPPSPDGHTLGDLAVAANGDVFASDSREPVLYRLRRGAQALERIVHPLFRSLQGIAPTADGRFVYVADWSHGLLRVELATGTVLRLPDAPNSTSLGCDGIVLHRGAIIAVQNGSAPHRVMRYVLDASGERIVRAEVLDQHLPLADEPTIGAIAGDDFVYVANSQWDKHDDNGVLMARAMLARPVLLAVPIPR